ncbi:hypothetical protein LR48_Vigan02g151300 [Vigna angularis]|uniref:Uncharacterized protein n=1 Tax=Phaseolus angularis TaxID=3914 RepID=A0A0L9TXP6_PHAAN|nr:hypothetical protein LR48_Vigan02g151300 [Vigna angularis]
MGNCRPPSVTLPSCHNLASRFRLPKVMLAVCEGGETMVCRLRSGCVCERVLLQWSWWMAVLAALRRPEKCLMVEMEVEEDAKDDDGGLATLAFAFCIGNGGGYRRRCWCWVMARLRQDGRVADGGLRLSMVLAAQGS